LANGQNSRENDYDCINILMRYSQLSNHFPNKFWCSSWVIKSGIWIHIFDKVRVTLVVLGHVICPVVCGCDYRPQLFVLFIRFVKINI